MPHRRRLSRGGVAPARVAAHGRVAFRDLKRLHEFRPQRTIGADLRIGLGVDRILTSGQEATVLEGLPLIADLVRQAKDRIIIMPGGGITARNVDRIVAGVELKEMHFAALEPSTSGMRRRREHVFMGGELRPPEYSRDVTDPARIRAIGAQRPPEYDRLATSAATIRSVMAKASG